MRFTHGPLFLLQISSALLWARRQGHGRIKGTFSVDFDRYMAGERRSIVIYIKNMTVAPGFDRNLSGEYATITVRQAIPQQI